MADEADMANDEVERHLERTLKAVNTEIPTNDSDACIWCGETIKEKDGRRWCSVDCRNEHELYANKL